MLLAHGRFPKAESRLGSPYTKDSSILGSTLGSPHFGKLPNFSQQELLKSESRSSRSIVQSPGLRETLCYIPTPILNSQQITPIQKMAGGSIESPGSGVAYMIPMMVPTACSIMRRGDIGTTIGSSSSTRHQAVVSKDGVS